MLRKKRLYGEKEITWVHGEWEAKLIGEEILCWDLAHIHTHSYTPTVLQIPSILIEVASM